MAIALLDVNVLVALFDPDHVHHDPAHDWFAEEGSAGWATCPITENGFLRVITHHGYHPDPPQLSAVAEQFHKFCSSSRHHHFWPDAISIRDQSVFEIGKLGSHRQLTDVYLLGVAAKMGGRLATFDRTINVAAVRAGKRHLTVIEPK